MTYTDFNDAGAHLSKPAWKYARDLVTQGLPGPVAIEQAEIFEAAMQIGANTKKVIYEKKSA
tara:strand:- start:336 stop:521 length:186 start_codon:yes stop_codon:yes gene_type:complete